ncbi:MAG: MmgE/PrpD family protein [Acidimicrobiia bacterium]
MKTYSQALAEFAFESFEAGLERNRQADQVGRVLDIVGNAIAAIREEPAAIVSDSVSHQAGSGRSIAIGTGRRMSARSAALINGTLAHALDFDDTHLPSVLHPSASVVPAALATADRQGSSGRELLAAIAIGNEVTCRLGMAAFDPELGNSVFFEKGLHATSICGTFGAAVAAALLLRCEADGLADAMGIAASMGAGLIEANRTGGSVKRLHCGWAAHGGVTAALLAAGGMTGPPTVLEGRFGFFNALTDGYCDKDALVGDLGIRWEIDRLFYKPYPANHFTHAGIDCARHLRAAGVETHRITDIQLGVPGPVLRTIAEPAEQKAAPANPYFAKFSGPYTVAAALAGGSGLGVGALDFTDETVSDPERLRLASLVTCYADERATEVFPHQFPAVLSLTLDDGSTVEHRIDHNRGGPENPLAMDELFLKFELNSSAVASPALIERIEAGVRSLPETEDISTLTGALEDVSR